MKYREKDGNTPPSHQFNICPTKEAFPLLILALVVVKKQLLKHDDLLKWCTSQISKIITKTENFKKKVQKSILYASISKLFIRIGSKPNS